MRVNVYSQELTDETRLIAKESDGRVVTGACCYPSRELSSGRRRLIGFEIECWERDGRPADMLDFTSPVRDVREEPVVYHAVQLMLHSSPMLHHPPQDDDRSAVTFWLPKSAARRESLAQAFEAMAKLVREAPAETGLD